MRKLKVEELGRMTVDAYKERPKNPLVVVLDNVRSAHNVGAIFRTADAFAIQEIVLCGICAVPPNKDIHKTALGATGSGNRIAKRRLPTLGGRTNGPQYFTQRMEERIRESYCRSFWPRGRWREQRNARKVPWRNRIATIRHQALTQCFGVCRHSDVGAGTIEKVTGSNFT
jgi:hypothetical protein